MAFASANDVLATEVVTEAVNRGIIAIADNRVTYRLNQQRSYNWQDPEEWVRDSADIVVYRDDRCRDPYLVVENKSPRQSEARRRQWIEQLFGNANSLRAPLGLYDEGDDSILFDVANFPAQEREANRRGDRLAIPHQYGELPQFTYIAGGAQDIRAADTPTLSSRIRRAHYIIWAGGRRDPLQAFDEWSKYCSCAS